jgi:hypothetical protein
MGLFRSRKAEVLFDASKVDVVALSPDEGTVELVVVADAPWTGSDAQLQSLQAKVQTYVSFALDGPLAQQYPDARGLPWRVVVDNQSGPPDARTSTVLDGLAERLPAYGGELTVRS